MNATSRRLLLAPRAFALAFDGRKPVLGGSKNTCWSNASFSTTTTPTTKAPSMNIAYGLKKEKETLSFRALLDEPIASLQGMGPKHLQAVQDGFGRHPPQTIRQLADNKFVRLAQAIQVLSELEESAGRLEGTAMNLNDGLDKEYETASLAELMAAPVSVLQGVSDKHMDAFAVLGIETVQDLAEWKYGQWVRAIQTAAEFEQAIDQEEETSK